MKTTQIKIPADALATFEAVENSDWEDGITISSLISWINDVADMYRPDDLDARSSKHFTERSFRHYQTLGCIDSPMRVGKEARYGFRQYLQALLIRKLIWQRVSTDQIADLMRDKSNEECKRMLFEGVEIIAQPAYQSVPALSSVGPETWRRHSIGEGVELNINTSLGAIAKADLKLMMSEIERILSKQGT